MSIFKHSWWTILAFSLTACVGLEKDDTATSDADDDESDTDTDTDSDTDTDTDTDTDSDTDTDTNEPPPSYLNPDFIIFTAYSGIESNELISVDYGGKPVGGTFRIVLFDSVAWTGWDDTTNACYLYYEANADTAELDTGFSSQDGGWVGWTFGPDAYSFSDGGCDNLDPNSNAPAIMDAFLAGNHGFGFGNLSADLETSMSDYYTSEGEDWAAVSETIFTGWVASTSLSEDGSMEYYDICSGNAYPIEDDAILLEEGTEMAIANEPSAADAFYFMNPWFGFTITP
jgi:hypothetical protein